MLDAKMKQYKHTHSKDMSCEAIAQMLSTTLYYRRFFPYYTYNMIAGIDNNGKGKNQAWIRGEESGHPQNEFRAAAYVVCGV